MAKDNSKLKTRSRKDNTTKSAHNSQIYAKEQEKSKAASQTTKTQPLERLFTVGYVPSRKDRNTPSITIAGNWLIEQGFIVGSKVNARMTHGCLFLTLEDSFTKKQKELLEEIKQTEASIKAYREFIAEHQY